MLAQIGCFELGERDVYCHGDGYSEAHHQPTIGQGIERAARIEPGEQMEDREPDHGPDECGHQCCEPLPCRSTPCSIVKSLPDKQGSKIETDTAYMKCVTCQRLAGWCALPEYLLSLREDCRQARDRFELVFVHSSGPMRSGVA